MVCQACHGANGNSANPDWPSLAGIGADYIADQLKNFKDGQTQQPGHDAECGQSDARKTWRIWAPISTACPIRDWRQTRRTGKRAKSSIEAVIRHAAIPACMACHGPTGRGNEPAKFPALRGQQSVYVSKQLNDYASGARSTGPNGIMQTIAKRLSPEDIRNLASYLQGIR